jgi:hypothetical protein
LSCIQQLMASSSGLGSTSGNKRQFHLIFLGLPQLHLHISAKEALHFFLVAFLPLLEGNLGRITEALRYTVHPAVLLYTLSPWAALPLEGPAGRKTPDMR